MGVGELLQHLGKRDGSLGRGGGSGDREKSGTWAYS